jgi:hypothetical protein
MDDKQFELLLEKMNSIESRLNGLEQGELRKEIEDVGAIVNDAIKSQGRLDEHIGPIVRDELSTQQQERTEPNYIQHDPSMQQDLRAYQNTGPTSAQHVNYDFGTQTNNAKPLSKKEERILRARQITNQYAMRHGLATQPINQQYVNNAELVRVQKPVAQNQRKSVSERDIGKFVLPVLASVMIFAAIVTFIVLIWNSLDVILRIGIVELIGIILTVSGLLLRGKINSIFSSFMIGTGAGAVYLGIVFTYIYGLLTDPITLFMMFTWVLLFLFVYRRTNLFLIAIIVQLGIIIASAQMFIMLSGSIDILMTVLFACASTLAIILCVADDRKSGKACALLIVSAVYMVSCFACTYVSYTDHLGDFNVASVIGMLMLQVVMYVALCMSFITGKVKESKCFACSIPIMILNVLVKDSFVNAGVASPIEFKGFVWLYLFDVVVGIAMCVLIQYLIEEKYYKLTCLFGILAILGTCNIANYYDISAGLSLAIPIILIVMLRFRVISLTYESLAVFIGVSICITWLARFSKTQSIFQGVKYVFGIEIQHLLWGIAYCAVMVYIIYLARKGKYASKAYRIYFMLIFLMSLYSLGGSLDLIVENEFNMFDMVLLQYIVILLGVGLIAKSGVLKEWDKDIVMFGNMFDSLDKTLMKFYWGVTSAMFVTGIALIDVYDVGKDPIAEDVLCFSVSVLAVLCVVCLQTSLMWHWVFNKLQQVWFCLMLTVLVCVVAGESQSNILISIAWIVLATVIIYCGFKMSLKGLRVYGLILLILSVIKITVLDMIEKSSILRVVLLLIGALICLGVSYMYNRFDKYEKS